MLHLPALITDLGLILGVGAITTLLFKKLKQPLVLGYILAGLLVGPNVSLFPTISEMENIETWSEIGVVFLLFSLGLEFSFKKLVKVGGSASVTAVVEVLGMALLGYSTGKLLGWSTMDSIFLGGILSVSSTTIIIRAFDEQGVKLKKFATLVFGVLVVEDLIAIVLMVVLSTVAVSQQFEGMEMLFSILKLLFFLVLWFVAGIFFIPTLLKKTRRLMNDETLLIVSLALCFLMVIAATEVGFSKELGAFIMGSILAETVQGIKIEHLIKPLKDLFGTVFFISVGMLINPAMIVEHIVPVLIISVVTVFGKSLTTGLGALLSGQPLKSSVQAGLSMAQIGEFSFIIATLGLSLGVISPFLYPIAVAVSAITTFTTPYLIRFSEPLYYRLEGVLPVNWKTALDTYSSGAQTITTASAWKKILRSYSINLILFSVIVIFIFLLSLQYIFPLLEEYEWGKIITAFVTLVLAAPFLWALSLRRTEQEAYTNIWVKEPSFRGPLIALQLSRIVLAIVYIGGLLRGLFSNTVALMVGLAIFAILALLSRKLQTFYSKIELRFLTNLNEKEIADKSVPRRNHSLSPWDTHFAEFELMAQSPVIGKPLKDLKLREEFGVNIAVIIRGEEKINVPQRTEVMYPGDIVSVIGTDAQLNSFKSYIEPMPTDELKPATKISLQQILVGKESSFIGKTIRESAIREMTKGLVVGIERDGDRILNPESTEIFRHGDVLWVVGDARRIQVISRENSDL